MSALLPDDFLPLKTYSVTVVDGLVLVDFDSTYQAEFTFRRDFLTKVTP